MVQAITSSFLHQSNGQVEICIKFVKCTIKKDLTNKDDINIVLLQIRSTPIGTRLPSPATRLFNRPIRALLPQKNKEPINLNADDKQYEALKAYQDKYLKATDTCKDSFPFPIGPTVSVQHKDGRPWTHGVVEEANDTDHHEIPTPSE